MNEGNEPLEPEVDARVLAALDQLAAALSEIVGEEVGQPIVVLARAPGSEGLMVFNAGIAESRVPLLLASASRTMLDRLPNLRRFRPEDE